MIIEESTSSGHHDYGYFRMLEEGFDVTVAAPKKKPLRTVVHMPFGLDGTWDTFQELPGFIIVPDASLDEIDPSAFAALVIPGGRGPEHLRVDNRCLAAGCIWVQTREAVVDGNIVTAGRRPDYDVWMRAFVSLLKERGIKPA
ncbi:MAG: DJ-1/PfpI family protein [Deltaproteobacteria bacterium]|nr:DJ-1/PfpI family protein [Deltaproteobacteria bacterium]